MANRIIEIEDLLESRVAEMASVNSWIVCWPNITFDSPREKIYIAVHQLPADTRVLDIQGEATFHTGIMQLNIVSPAGVGVRAARDVAQQITTWFPANTRFQRNSLQVWIDEPPQIAAGIQDDTTYTIPVSIAYTSATV